MGTGFRWAPAALPAAVRLVRERRGPGAAGRPGGALDHAFVLVADAAGRYTLRFELRRGWEPEAARVHEARVTVA